MLTDHYNEGTSASDAVLYHKLCRGGEIGRRNGLKRNLSARREIGDVELLKVGETCNMAIPSQARPKLAGKV